MDVEARCGPSEKNCVYAKCTLFNCAEWSEAWCNPSELTMGRKSLIFKTLKFGDKADGKILKNKAFFVFSGQSSVADVLEPVWDRPATHEKYLGIQTHVNNIDPMTKKPSVPPMKI
jgi:hypothetical protein